MKWMKQVQVVHAIITKNGQILLGKRSESKKNEPGYWASIGGRLELGETLEVGLIRECREEIDVVVKPIRKMLEINEPDSIHYWFEVEIVSGTPKLANEEHTELKWFSKSEVERLSLVVSEDLEIARKLPD